MANLLAIPTDFYDGDGNSPPACWDGQKYTVFNDVAVLNLNDSISPAQGDNLAFTATCTLGQSHIDIEYIGTVDGQDQTIHLVNDDLAIGSKSYDVPLPVGGRAYEIRIDAGFGCNSDTVTLVPTAATPAPVSPDETINVIVNSSNNAVVPVITLDGAQVTPDSLAIDTAPAHGSANVSGTSLLYTPAADYSGDDSFTYHAVVGGVSSNTATVDITVVPPSPPAQKCCELGRVTRAYVSGYQRDRIHFSRLTAKETRCLTANFNGAVCAGRTIASVAWSVINPSLVFMQRADITDLETSVLIQCQYPGRTVVRCTATFDNAESYTQLFSIQIMHAPWFQDDYTQYATGPYVLHAESSQ